MTGRGYILQTRLWTLVLPTVLTTSSANLIFHSPSMTQMGWRANMSEQHNLFNTLRSFDLGDGRKGQFYSLPALQEAGLGTISRLPVSIRLVLESVLRNCDAKKVSE